MCARKIIQIYYIARVKRGTVQHSLLACAFNRQHPRQLFVFFLIDPRSDVVRERSPSERLIAILFSRDPIVPPIALGRASASRGRHLILRLPPVPDVNVDFSFLQRTQGRSRQNKKKYISKSRFESCMTQYLLFNQFSYCVNYIGSAHNLGVCVLPPE